MYLIKLKRIPTTTTTNTRLCSFCRSSEHNKSKCNRYKRFHTVATRVIQCPIWIERSVSDYQKWVCQPVCEYTDYAFNYTLDDEFMRCQYSHFTVNDKEFKRQEERRQGQREPLHDDASMDFLHIKVSERIAQYREYCEERQVRQAIEALRVPRRRQATPTHTVYVQATYAVAEVVSQPRILVTRNADTPTVEFGSCGICLSDEIPTAKMVKTGCNHEYCDACISKIIHTKPCCAFCRAIITELSVNSQNVYNKFHV